MKEFWKKSAALLMAISLLMGNNYVIHASGEEGEQPTETQETTPEGETVQSEEQNQSANTDTQETGTVDNTTDNEGQEERNTTPETPSSPETTDATGFIVVGVYRDGDTVLF